MNSKDSKGRQYEYLFRSSSTSLSLVALSISRVAVVLLLLLLLLFDEDTTNVYAARTKRRNGNPQARPVRVLNQCGVKVDIYWIHPDTGELASSSTNGDGVMFGGETGIDSYVGHEFEVREVENNKTKRCRTINKCLHNTFAVNTNEEQSKFNLGRESE
jgi:hypothetical protein